MESVSAIFCLKVSVSVAKKWYRCISLLATADRNSDAPIKDFADIPITDY